MFISLFSRFHFAVTTHLHRIVHWKRRVSWELLFQEDTSVKCIYYVLAELYVVQGEALEVLLPSILRKGFSSSSSVNTA
jgi:hypothetical protein